MEPAGFRIKTNFFLENTKIQNPKIRNNEMDLAGFRSFNGFFNPF